MAILLSAFSVWDKVGKYKATGNTDSGIVECTHPLQVCKEMMHTQLFWKYV